MRYTSKSLKPWLLLLLLLAGLAAPRMAVQGAQDDERLETLFVRLHAASDPTEAKPIEAGIWKIWLDSGTEDVNRMMRQGLRAMMARDYDAALLIFDQVVEAAPDYAEGWNKRATVHWLRDDLDASVRDILRTLDLEPRHFGALSGMGLILMEVDDREGAIRAFEEVLRIHPNAAGAKAHIEHLRHQQREQAI